MQPQQLLAQNSIPVKNSVAKKFGQADKMVEKATAGVNRVLAKNVKGLAKFLKAGTIVSHAGFLYVPLMALSTEELAKLNLTDPLKHKLVSSSLT
jgi:hypothetical protein